VTDPSLPSRPIAPIPSGGRSRAWLWVVVSGALGALGLAGTFLLVRSRLPTQIPSHYGLSGQVTATMAPVDFVVTGLLLQAGVTAILTLVLYASLRSGVIEQQQGPGVGRVLGALLSFVAALIVPAPLILAVLGDAGFVSGAGGAFPAVPLLVLPIALLVVLISLRIHGGPTLRAVQFACSACGESFEPPTWRWIVGPHIGASVYLTCPRCGERGWDVRVGARVWNSGPEPSDSQRLP
jgi:hypothetical protein